MTTTVETPAPFRSRVSARPVSLLGSIRSEWIKLLSLRSSQITCAVLVVIWCAFVSLVSYSQARSALGEEATGPGSRPPGFLAANVVDSATQASAGAIFAQLVVVVLAGLAVAGEYSTGSVRSSLLAVPSRVSVVIGKVVAVSVTVLALATVSSFAAFYLAGAFLADADLDTAIGDPDQLQIVVGSALYVTVVALFTIGIGLLLRHVAATIATAMGSLLLLPMLISALPDDWSDNISPWLPSSAGMQIMAAPNPDATLQPWQGLGVFAAYALVLVVAGWWTMNRRDA
jgi:ABC-type transport system involved in multi-copper enzyme maturation permease subunit